MVNPRDRAGNTEEELSVYLLINDWKLYFINICLVILGVSELQISQLTSQGVGYGWKRRIRKIISLLHLQRERERTRWNWPE